MSGHGACLDDFWLLALCRIALHLISFECFISKNTTVYLTNNLNYSKTVCITCQIDLFSPLVDIYLYTLLARGKNKTNKSISFT
jgi:hypothetical protein